MKIAILGATGKTGQCLVHQALEHGHTVTALVRNLDKLTMQHSKLKVVEADIFSADSLKPHFEGQDVVMSSLGFLPSRQGVTGYSQSMKAVVSAMREAKLNTIIVMTSWYTKANTGIETDDTERSVHLQKIRSCLSDMYEMETFLEDIDDINWTVVRPPCLRDRPVTDEEFLTVEGAYYLADSDGQPMHTKVSREDVARFMLSLLNSNPWVKKAVIVTTK